MEKPNDDEIFQSGVNHFNQSEFFEAHEVWEDLWMEASGPRRAFYQGMIQVAVALHHLGNENLNGAEKLLASALGYLEKGRSDSGPVKIEKMIDHLLDTANYVRHRKEGKSSDELSEPKFQVPLDA